MKRSRCTEQQVFEILREGEAGGTVKEVCRIRWHTTGAAQFPDHTGEVAASRSIDFKAS